MSARARLLLADHQTLFRESLHKALGSEPDLSVVGEAGDARGALRLTKDLTPDLLLLDWWLPDAPGELILRGLGSSLGRTRVVVLTAAMDRAAILSALESGARGLVLKASGYTELIKAIHCVLSGQYWVGRDSLADLVDVIRRLTAAPPAGKSAGEFGLTKRENDIVSAIVEACTNKVIAERYSISEKTVKHHLTHIFEKIGVSSRLELARFARTHNLHRGGLDMPASVRDPLAQPPSTH
jgi:two-component system, NarL family, nitrate/nitrite response regulator NarL